MGGVSLNRINKVHVMSDVTDLDQQPISFDHYTLKIDQSAISASGNKGAANRATTGASFPIVYANDSYH